ncbi:DUF2442 domain-containing protein [Castellaniella caeni]|uniref:DUF2442 domain-containing protein n=1 Tax=Castellaniella caeni TaxID=266123 RepID=UPI000C9F5427|nr:DUF2442 domain-containing protein [Castellaniella caeni]
MTTPDTPVGPHDEPIPETGYAESARYEPASQHIAITLRHGIVLTIPVRLLQGLADAPPASLNRIEVSPMGTGLYWPDLDVDLYIPSLIQGLFGTRRWMASLMGKAGGSARSNAKTQAARINGRKGGRPRKKPDAG